MRQKTCYFNPLDVKLIRTDTTLDLSQKAEKRSQLNLNLGMGTDPFLFNELDENFSGRILENFPTSLIHKEKLGIHCPECLQMQL